MFTDEDLQKGIDAQVLGPAYFDSSRVVAKIMEKFEADQFKPLVDKITQQVNESIWDSVQSHLLIDTEMNLQGDLWRMVDNCVKALLTGDKWALDRYVLAERHNDGEKVRAAVAKYIPVELQQAIVADLQAEVKRLSHDLKFYRSR